MPMIDSDRFKDPLAALNEAQLKFNDATRSMDLKSLRETMHLDKILEIAVVREQVTASLMRLPTYSL
ncbi:hypothetical protein DND58_23995 [Pseudomonas syringae pv. pisi]|nr:hypothetical protein DND62_28185 [Pseudomonas syringae pv. pisi]PYD26406.1 hypothetical protein DND58_23995 [Pseudomonas syringae pv. pisi]